MTPRWIRRISTLEVTVWFVVLLAAAYRVRGYVRLPWPEMLGGLLVLQLLIAGGTAATLRLFRHWRRITMGAMVGASYLGAALLRDHLVFSSFWLFAGLVFANGITITLVTEGLWGPPGTWWGRPGKRQVRSNG